MMSFRKRLLSLTVTLAAGGTCLQIGGCGPGTAVGFLASLNPCGVILACDQAEFEFITSGYRGPGVDVNIDPFCTFPPFCVGGVDPIFGGIFGGGP